MVLVIRFWALDGVNPPFMGMGYPSLLIFAIGLSFKCTGDVGFSFIEQYLVSTELYN